MCKEDDAPDPVVTLKKDRKIQTAVDLVGRGQPSFTRNGGEWI